MSHPRFDTPPPPAAPSAPDVPVMPAAILAVIPTLNEARHIETCIRSLMTGAPALRQVPLVVADGGSTDGTQAIVDRLMVEFPNLSRIDNPQRLQSAALNLAAAQAPVTARCLVRCDAHSIYPENFILDVAEALQRKGAASLVIPMDAEGSTCFERANAWIVDTPLGSGGSAHRGGRTSGYVDHGHHAGFDLDWFRRVGGYDATFSHNEDAEYDERLAQMNGKVWLDADIRIRYVPRGSFGKLARQYFNYGKGRARTVLKHRQRMKLRQSVPILALLASLGGLIGGVVFAPLFILPLGYAAVLACASVGVALWKRSVCGLLAGPISGVLHMSWAAGFLKQVVFGTRKPK